MAETYFFNESLRKMPKLTIGLPVRNGENFITPALESLLSQSFEDFNVLIIDNASSDSTQNICREYTKRDARVQYIRNEHNIGAAPNFNKCFFLSRSTYFKWMAHDDVLGPEYLRFCIDALDANADAVLCQSGIEIINENGDILYYYNKEDNRFRSTNRVERFRNAIDLRYDCISIFGVIRSEKLRQTALIKSYVGSDRELLAHLSILGPFAWIDQALFYSREHQARSVRAIKKYRRGSWFDTRHNALVLLPHFKFVTSVSRTFLFKSKASVYEIVCLFSVIGEWLWKFKKEMLHDAYVLLSSSFDYFLGAGHDGNSRICKPWGFRR